MRHLAIIGFLFAAMLPMPARSAEEHLGPPLYLAAPHEQDGGTLLHWKYNVARPEFAQVRVLDSWKAEAGKAILKFTSIGSGLAVKNVELGGHMVNADRLQGFELAGEDRRFSRASAELQGNDTVVVSAMEVPPPLAVRYAWAAFPLCNLYNREGFAAYPFRTDDWPFPTPAEVGYR